MFTALGILSLVAGIMVFFQSSTMISLESLAAAFGATNNNLGGMFAIVAILLIVGGALSIASNSGEKRGFVKASAWLWGITAVIGFANFSSGDMKIWAVACGVLCAIYVGWMRNHPDY
jgi:hypothetical protein